MKKNFSIIAFLLIISLIFGSVLTSCSSTPKEVVYVYPGTGIVALKTVGEIAELLRESQ